MTIGFSQDLYLPKIVHGVNNKARAFDYHEVNSTRWFRDIKFLY
jgi:hypothetical protein